MNFLAHLRLAGDDPEAQVGQVLADLLAGTPVATLPPGIQAGIRAHQRIDAFTDRHVVVEASRRRFTPPYRRFAGVLLDVYFDHLLARNWERYGDGSRLEDFAESRYSVLARYRHLPVGRYRTVVNAMRSGRWLEGYADFGGVERALQGLARRFSRENPVASAGSVLLQLDALLEDDFARFFPDLVAFSRTVTRERAERSLGAGTGP